MNLHIFVLVNRQTNGIEWTYSAYLVVGIVAGLMGLFNLNIVDEAIQTLVKATIDAREANQILEDTVKIRTIELAEANATLLIANQHLEAISMTDGLTGIANRRLFDKTLQSELNRCLRCQSNDDKQVHRVSRSTIILRKGKWSRLFKVLLLRG